MSETKQETKTEIKSSHANTKNDNDKTAGKLAVVRVRSGIMQSKKLEDTFIKLKLMRPNYCVIVPNNPSHLGMLKKIQHLITWGELDAETEKLLEAKREKGKKAIRLQAPLGGYERKGTKVPFKLGGAVGNRGDAINKLLRKMLRA